MTCGFTKRVRDRCSPATSTPASSSAAARPSARFGKVDRLRTIEVADGRTLDLPTDVADLAFSYITLQHCEHDDALDLAAEAVRVVRPGGSVALNFRSRSARRRAARPAGALDPRLFRIPRFGAWLAQHRTVARLAWQANRLHPDTVLGPLPAALTDVTIWRHPRSNVSRAPAPPRARSKASTPTTGGSSRARSLTAHASRVSLEMRVGVVGATGQVGGVMRRLLAEREFPVDEIRFFASARSAGTTLPWKGARHHRRGRRARRPDRPRHRPVLGRRQRRRRVLAPQVRRRRRHRHRQLVGVADGSRRAARRQRGQRPTSPQRAEGHHRQPQLHDDGGDAGAQAAPRRSRARAADRQHLPGRVAAAGLAGVDELDKQARQVADRAAELTHDGEAVAFPAPEKFARPIAFNVLPFAGKIVDDGRVRDRRGAEAPQREPQDPRHPRPRGVAARACGCRCSPATRCRSTPSSPGRCRSSGRSSCSPRRRASSSSTSRPRSRRPARTRASSAASASDPGVPDGRGLALFVSNDNLRKGAALNAVQIAELFLT